MRFATRCVLLALVIAPAGARGQERPDGWQLRFDKSDTPDSSVSFVTMAPGWHITTGPRVILYHPETRAEGTFRIQSTMHVFPGARREAFGVFIGGSNLQEPSQAYTYFVIRGDGRFLVKQRHGTSTTTVHPWTEHEAIVPMGTESAENVLAVDVGAESIAFFINGTEVTRVPKAGVETDGVVGLRVNHRLNIHVADLTVTPAGR